MPGSYSYFFPVFFSLEVSFEEDSFDPESLLEDSLFADSFPPSFGDESFLSFPAESEEEPLSLALDFPA